jgi:ABC-type Fe3+-siderophore transport system permease subunit
MSHILPRYYLDLVKDTILYAIWQVKIYRKYSMIFVGIIIGIAILSAMIYLAVNKKSSFIIRLASLGAIAIMLITVVICVIIIFSDKTVAVERFTGTLPIVPVEEPEKKDNSIVIIFFIVFLLVLFIVIAVASMREHKKNKPKLSDISDSKPISNW